MFDDSLNMEGLYEQALAWFALYGLRIVGALLIFIFGFWLSRKVSHIFEKALSRAKVDETLTQFGGQIIRIGLYVLVIITALGKVGVNTTSVITVLGAATLALSLSLQSNLSNLAAGVMILVFRPFKLKDFIEAGGALGTVEQITVMATWLKMPDGKALIMPNAQVLGSQIINYSAKEIRRIDLVFGISYDDDLPATKKLLLEILKQDDRVLEDPAPRVDVLELADSSVNLAVRPWVRTADFWDTRCELIETVKIRFDEAGITIPYPQRDIHLYPREGVNATTG
jgi:small conductance mechanosensitive channel